MAQHIPHDEPSGPVFSRPHENGFGDSEFGRALYKGVEVLASLKFTVVLFALAIILVLAGTLVQTEKDIYRVLHDHFYPWLTYFPLRIFMPESFFPNRPELSDAVGFWFPGGALIGTAMFINLLAAHSIRFKIQSKGSRLWAGIGVIALGSLVTYMVIRSGSNPEGFQAEAMIEWDVLWQGLKFGLGAAWVALASSLLKIDSSRKLERWSIVGLTLISGVGLVYLFWRGEDLQLDDSGMRILWQLIKGEAAAAVLLVGCILVFKKRAGVVLLHAGVGLLMFSELFVTMKNEEAQMPIFEGETVNYTQDARHPELAIVDRSPEDHNKVVVVPTSQLRQAAENETVIEHRKLPFDIRVTRFYQHSTLVRRSELNPQMRGAGRSFDVQKLPPGKGTDTDAAFDIASIYAELIEKESSKNLGKYLFSVHLREQQIEVDGKKYSVALRHKRIYKPYSIHLIDVRGDKYLGTTMAKNYSSTFRLVDESRNVNREVTIKMNEPLRYAGETFYQSGYLAPPTVAVEQSTFQVVTNQGWMIPYVACMIIMTGMLSHFWLILLRFLNRRAAGTIPVGEVHPLRTASADSAAARQPATARTIQQPADGSALPSLLRPDRAAVWFPVAVCVLFGGWLVGKMFVRPIERDGMNVSEFGKLPVVASARLKPFDSFARNNLRMLSEGETVEDGQGNRQPAIVWFLDVVTDPQKAGKYRAFRVTHPEVLQSLGLPRRKGYYYTLNEIRGEKNDAVIDEQVHLGQQRKQAGQKPTPVQGKFVGLKRSLRRYESLQRSFRVPPAEVKNSEDEFIRFLVTYRDKLSMLPLAAPNPGDEKFPWLPLANLAGKHWARQLARENGLNSWDELGRYLARAPRDSATTKALDRAALSALAGRMGGSFRGAQLREHWDKLPEMRKDIFYGAVIANGLRELTADTAFEAKTRPEAAALVNLLQAAKADDAAAFNEGIEKYNALLAESQPEDYDRGKLEFESWINRFAPYFNLHILYLVPFVLTVIGWLGWSRPLNRAAFGLLALTFVVHTLALIARMYISGRWGVTVTNLYSSAIFIGWAACLFGLIFESVYRLGIGNAVAAVAGFASLRIAHYLSFDGDTISVMQAVLDTNFWLATHVTTITLGYSATFVAGLLGVGYIATGFCSPGLTKDVGRVLNRMVYGSLCFAIFFSLIGTVLGGLWADDSWGRFWGWDPKENGALIIVLWNALVLHARWGGMVKERGLAVLVVGGNIVTAWSWFGVNLLNVGLHSYGEQEGTFFWLAMWWLVNLAIIGLGCAPKEMWWSFRKREEASLERA